MSKTHKKRGGRGEMTKSVCSPTRRLGRYTCYNDKVLQTMKTHWNARHPDVKIKTKVPKDIWNKLREYMSNVCNSERCWLRQQFMHNKLDVELSSYTFAPKAPETWKKKPHEWLTSLDIDRVMKQWERKHKDFEFIGPSPIDFDTRLVNKQCVWTELCKFEMQKYLSRNKTKIGIIFNTDPHYKDGSHWIALYIDLNKEIIVFFDSNGDRIPKQVKVLVERITKQGDALDKNFTFMENYPKEHQKGNTECGIYTIYFLTQLLEGKKSPKYFQTHRITDKEMFKLRRKYFEHA